MTALALVEMTRKKVGSDLGSFLLDACPVCRAAGTAQSKTWIARKLKAALKRLFAQFHYESALVSLEPSLAEFLLKSRYFAGECEGIWHDKRIYLVPNPAAKPQGFAVSGTNAKQLHLPNDAKLLY
jgi:Ribonuclease G/E